MFMRSMHIYKNGVEEIRKLKSASFPRIAMVSIETVRISHVDIVHCASER